MFSRRKAVTVQVDSVSIGGDSPIVVQSMTNTDTADAKATVLQVKELAEAGSELVRVTVNSDKAAQAVPLIVDQLKAEGVPVPLVGDFHYNGHLLLTRYPDCATSLSKYRINPGNVSVGRHGDKNFRQIIEVAVDNAKPVRIGVNWGSLDQKLLARLMDENAKRSDPKTASAVVREAMVLSALESANAAETFGLSHDRIILSAKVSSVSDLVAVYRDLGKRCDYPLHLGLTEAGMGTRGIIASAAALGILLEEGIGDTIRVSLTPRPEGNRAEEVAVAQQILQVLDLRHFTPQVSACPGCGRTASVFFQQLADEIQQYLETAMIRWRQTHSGVEELKVAVMGCVVNGPGESKHAHIGISLPGAGEDPKAPVFIDGRHFTTLGGPGIAQRFVRILEEYVEKRYGTSADSGQARV